MIVEKIPARQVRRGDLLWSARSRSFFEVMARNAAACDLVPVGVVEADGKACATCGEPLVGDALAGGLILAEEWVA